MTRPTTHWHGTTIAPGPVDEDGCCKDAPRWTELQREGVVMRRLLAWPLIAAVDLYAAWVARAEIEDDTDPICHICKETH